MAPGWGLGPRGEGGREKNIRRSRLAGFWASGGGRLRGKVDSGFPGVTEKSLGVTRERAFVA